MDNSWSKPEVIVAIVSVIVAVLSIVVSIVLVKDARNFFARASRRLIDAFYYLWDILMTRIAIILFVEVAVLYFLFNAALISFELSLTVVLISLFITVLTLTVIRQLKSDISRKVVDVKQLPGRAERERKLESTKVKVIRKKWPEFMNELSNQLSSTAIHSLLQMAQVYDVNDMKILLIVPDALSPTLDKLEGRLKDVGPVLKKIFGEPYSLEVYATDEIPSSVDE